MFIRNSAFDIRHSDFFRHLNFDFRHSVALSPVGCVLDAPNPAIRKSPVRHGRTLLWFASHLIDFLSVPSVISVAIICLRAFSCFSWPTLRRLLRASVTPWLTVFGVSGSYFGERVIDDRQSLLARKLTQATPASSDEHFLLADVGRVE